MQEWSKLNKGYRYMLNVIDVFSKYVWSIPLRDKKGTTVLDAFIQIVNESNRIPKHIWVDEGKEFYNKDITSWLKENNIIRYSTHGEHKSAVIERFNRTLKEMMWKRFTAENTRNWINMLDRLISDYNNRIHSTLGMTPTEASLKTNLTEAIQNTLNKTRIILKSKIKFKIDDRVRISRIKGLFEKGYLPNWSEALYIIDEVQKTVPVTYKIKDSMGRIIEGSFYNEELQKSDQEVYRVEKVIRKKKIDGIDHAYVKWSGYSDEYNQWIPMKDLEKLN
jgi:Chromo (CHRromatin Organisation MOdifier) domain